MSAKTDNSPGVRAVNDAAAYLAVVQGLATGALVFSLGLLTAQIQIIHSVRWLLFVAWGLFILSIFVGILARGAVVSELSHTAPNVYSAALITTSIVSVVSFFLGSAFLGAMLILTLASRPDVQGYAVQSAMSAAHTADAAISESQRSRIMQIGTIELIKGADANSPENSTWHVRFDLAPRSAASAPSVDVLIDATTGKVTLIRGAP